MLFQRLFSSFSSFSSFAGFTECGLTQCGGCGEGTVGASVLKYQESGRRILISVGGANADATNMDPDKGTSLADAIWQMYLGGQDARYKVIVATTMMGAVVDLCCEPLLLFIVVNHC